MADTTSAAAASNRSPAPSEPADRPLSVVVIDDEAPNRQLVRLLLARHQLIAVVGEAADGEEGIRTVGQLLPDIVVLDRQMPRMTGDEALGPIREASPGSMVVILSALPPDDAADRLLAAGAFAYLEKRVLGPRFPAQLVALYREYR